MATVCWLMFNPPILDIATFAGHTHDIAYIGDLPAGGILVPCLTCHVNSQIQTLTYDALIEPPDEAGVIITAV
jgi:hypothetical protein